MQLSSTHLTYISAAENLSIDFPSTLHLPVHCRWEHIHDGIVRDNCLNNTHTLGPFLKLMGVETGVPLYVASYWADVEPGLNTTVMQSLSDAGYQVCSARQMPSLLVLQACWGLAPTETQGPCCVMCVRLVLQVVTSLSLLGGALASGSAGVGREQLAQIDYIIALAAHRFIGTSVASEGKHACCVTCLPAC
jgi:hypothetical protein